MQITTAGAIGGVVAGAITSAVMLLGHETGLLKKSLSHDAQDWLDRTFHTRDRFGNDGTEAVEQVTHYAASAGLGMTYAGFRRFIPLPGVLAGAAFGAGVYAVGVAGVLPELGVTKGERHAEPGQATERLLTHLAFGAILGLVTDALRDRPRKTAPRTPARAAVA